MVSTIRIAERTAMRKHRLQPVTGLGEHHVVGGGHICARNTAARPSVRGTLINAMSVAASATRRAVTEWPFLADDNASAVRDGMARGQHVAEIVDKERSAVEPLADRRRPGDVARQRGHRFDLSRRLKQREWHLRCHRAPVVNTGTLYA